MKQILTLILILLIAIPAATQPKTRGKVKRKYRDQERVIERSPPVLLRGKIKDADDNLLPGAHIMVLGTKKSIHANEDGEYFLYGLAQGLASVQVSFVGFQTKSTDFYLQTGVNFLNFTLDEDNIRLDEISVTSQKRNQQILDVPITISAIDSEFLHDNNIKELDELSEFVPGFQVRMQGDNRPSFVIRGLTSDEVSPAAQPRISVFYNNVPINRASGASLELFDMQQVEVLKGPQNTLFGRGAQIGAIHYVSHKPTSDFYGSVSAGIGEFAQREIKGIVNIPIMKDKLMARAAAVYDYNSGYINNTLGGKLNGKNTVAGRFSLRFIPTFQNKIDLVLNYQRDRAPGLGFMSMDYPNMEGSTNPFAYVASIEQGDKLATDRDIFDATLTMKHFNNENNYLTSTSSYHSIGAYSRWDGDGTAAAAIDMSEDIGSRQFYQELRYNFSLKNQLNGSIGGSFWLEKASQDYWFSTNEQDMFHLIFDTGSLVDDTGLPLSVPNLPFDPNLGNLAGAPLAANHQEENLSDATNRAIEGFLDFTYHLTQRISVFAGARVFSEKFRLTNQAQMLGDNASTLGSLTGNYPNLLFAESDENEIKETSFAYTYRGGLKYAYNEDMNLFASYSKGRRPQVLQFTSTGEEQVLEAETVDNYEVGFKTSVLQRIWFDVAAYYQEYKNFQTSAWVADANSGEFNYLVKDAGKATSYGGETSLKVAIVKDLDFFGNYAYIHARFDSLNVNGEEQEYAGNTFRLTPEHSFAVGFRARTEISPGTFLFAVPSYSWRSKVYFEDANTPGFEQAEYGILNFRAGIELIDRGLTIAFYGTNILEEEYIVSAGNTGSLFGAPTQIPGAPRMFGTKVTMKFKVKEKPYYQRSRWNR